MDAFDLKSAPLNFHSSVIKQCEWRPAIRPTVHSAAPASLISPCTICMLMRRGLPYVLLKHNHNCFLVLKQHISYYTKKYGWFELSVCFPTPERCCGKTRYRDAGQPRHILSFSLRSFARLVQLLTVFYEKKKLPEHQKGFCMGVNGPVFNMPDSSLLS